MKMETNSSNDFKIPIVSWSHGNLQPDAANKLLCEVLSDVQNPQNIIAVLASDNNENAHLSKRDESPFCNNFMVLRNRKTNSIRLYEIENFLMLPYRAQVESRTNSQVKSEEKSVIQNASLNLNKAMGSKRNKRRVTEIEKADIHVDDVEKKLKKAIKDNELVVKEEIETISSSNQTCLPPCDRDANSIEEVYKVNDLISLEILNTVENIAQDILQMNISELSEDKRLSPFFLKTFAQISKRTPLKVKLLLFVDSLLKFLNAPFRELKKKIPVFCEYSSLLNKKLLQDFCITLIDGKLARPPSMRDKALCYILVLLLLVNDFTLDINLLSGHLTAPEYQKLPKLLRAIGAKPDKNSAVNFCLKLPLAELSLNSGRRSGNFSAKRR